MESVLEFVMENKWYYAENRQQKGPVSRDELKSLLAGGNLQAATLVWHAGLTTWQAAANFPELWEAETQKSAETPSGIDPLLPLQEPTASVSAPVPELSQRADFLPEAAAVPELAGLWRRFWAMLLDDIIVQVMLTPVTFLLAGSTHFLQRFVPFHGQAGDSLIVSIFTLLALVATVICSAFIFQFVYSGFFLSRYAATPGKMALGIQVVRSNGSRVSFLRGGSRFLAAKLSAWLLFVGYLIAFFDDQKRTLHDHLCDTRVVSRVQGAG